MYFVRVRVFVCVTENVWSEQERRGIEKVGVGWGRETDRWTDRQRNNDGDRGRESNV